MSSELTDYETAGTMSSELTDSYISLLRTMSSELMDSETAVLHQLIGDHDYWGPEPFRGATKKL